MGRASSRGDDDTDDSVSGEGSLRLNPAVVRKRGMKLTGASPETSMGVIDISGKVSGKGIARPDNSSLRLEVGAAEESDRGLFGGMLNGAEAGCESFCSCLPLANALGVRSRSRTSDATEASAIELEPLSRDASQYTREKNKMPPKRTTWWQVTLYIINDVIGAFLILYSSVILGMYGWVLGLLILILMWPLNLYTAHLLWRCRNIFPGAISIGDLVFYVTRSSVAMYITFAFVNATILLTLASQIDSAAANIYWFFSSEEGGYSGKCFAAFLAGAVGLLIPLTQLRYLSSLTLINVINITCMLVFVCISVYMVCTNGRYEDAVTRVGPNTEAIKASVDVDSLDGQAAPLLGIDIIVTGMYYQLIILEIIAEMRHTKEFPKANYWSSPVILFVAISCAITQYYFQGEAYALESTSVQQVLTSLFDYENRGRTALAYVGVVCFSIHMIGCCVIRSVILTRSFHLLINPAVANQQTWRTRLEWLGISVVVLGLAFTLTLFIRFLGLMSILNGLLALLTSIALPVVLYILCCKKRKTLGKIPKPEWAVMVLILLLCLATIVAYVVLIVQRAVLSEGGEVSKSTMEQVREILDCSGFKAQP